MANSTSKSSKPKTKTTKKITAKSVATRAAKTARVTKNAKATAAKSVTTTKKPVQKATVSTSKAASVVTGNEIKQETTSRRAARALTAGTLRRWHLFSAVVFAVLAVLAMLLMNDTSYQLLRGHLAGDVLASQTQTVFAPAQHAITGVQIRWLVVASMTVSALFSAWRYYNAARERQALNLRISPWRWVDTAVTGALIIETVAFLSGMQEVASLKLLGALVASSAVFAWIAERENAGADRVVRGALSASFVTGVLSLLALSSYALATIVYGIVRSPWYVYALYAAVGLTLLALALLQIRQYRGAGKWANYLFIDRAYVALNLLAKVAFAVILIIGLYR